MLKVTNKVNINAGKYLSNLKKNVLPLKMRGRIANAYKLQFGVESWIFPWDFW